MPSAKRATSQRSRGSGSADKNSAASASRCTKLFFHADRAKLEALAKELAAASFEADEITEDTDEEGKPLFYITLRAKVIPRNLEAVFAMSKVADAADTCGASYLSWEAKSG